MIFLFPLDVVLVVLLVVVEGGAVVVAADVLNTAPLLCAAFREVLSSAGCTFVSTAFSDDSKSLLMPRMMSQTDRWAEAVETEAARRQGMRRAGILIVAIFAADQYCLDTLSQRIPLLLRHLIKKSSILHWQWDGGSQLTNY